MIKIYHNPRCQKSREGLAFLKATGKEFEIVKYLDNNISEKELKGIIFKLGIKPIDLIRKNESIWKSDFKDKKLSDAEIVKAMIDHPKLIERPIIVNNEQAVIGRPSKKIKTIIN
jgi:arsenate reductase